MFASFSPSRLPGASPYLTDSSPYARPPVSAPTPGAATPTVAYRYPGGQQQQQPPQPATSVALAYNQLVSSMAAHLHQQGKVNGSAPGVLENLEKLAALAAGASSSSPAAAKN